MFEYNEYIVRETGYPGAVKQEVVGELVRCKDCVKVRHEIYANSEVWLCDCYYVSHVCEANDYCSYGERRNDA